MPWKHPSRWAGIVLVLAALALYLLTLDNGLRPGELEGGDLITHQYAQVQARPSNAPGYPLYTLGGWAWFHGLRSLLGQHANPTAILSAYSTLWALLALWLLYQLIVDLTGNWGIGLLLGAFYAVTYFFWYYAVSTEQYARPWRRPWRSCCLPSAGRQPKIAPTGRAEPNPQATAFSSHWPFWPG